MENKLKKPNKQYTGICKKCNKIFQYSNENLMQNNLGVHQATCKGEKK
jgi:hypothetical protein